jgi:radical SAM protein with 4Fe4S-binding SPASM domain
MTGAFSRQTWRSPTSARTAARCVPARPWCGLPAGFTDPQTFCEIARILGGQKSLVSFSGMGDPLLHPLLTDSCRELKKQGADVRILVNAGSLARYADPEKLVLAGPNSIAVSFPSARKEVYRRLCPGASFEMALDAVRALVRLARDRVSIRVSGVRTRINQDEGAEFVRFWKAEGVRAEMADCHGRGGNLAASDLYVPGDRGLTSGRCGLFSFHTFVTWQGDVLACCHDLTGETRLGNLLDEGAEEIGNRKRQILGEARMFELCRRCDEPLRLCDVPDGPRPTTRKARRVFRNLLFKKER